jgi:hypothetical protein
VSSTKDAALVASRPGFVIHPELQQPTGGKDSTGGSVIFPEKLGIP